MRYILALALILALAAPTLAWQARVERVLDGDTIDVLRLENNERIRIRLYGIDCPEGPGARWQAQPYSRRATGLAKRLLPKGIEVAVFEVGQDKYARTVAGIITLPDGLVVQEELIRAGLAWVDPRYCKRCVTWEDLQNTARAACTGLWQSSNPTPPWQWRKSAQDD